MFYSFYVDFPYHKQEIKEILRKMYKQLPNTKPWCFEVFNSIDKDKSVILFFHTSNQSIYLKERGIIPPTRTLFIHNDKDNTLSISTKPTRQGVNNQHFELHSKRTESSFIYVDI